MHARERLKRNNKNHYCKEQCLKIKCTGITNWAVLAKRHTRCIVCVSDVSFRTIRAQYKQPNKGKRHVLTNNKTLVCIIRDGKCY